MATKIRLARGGSKKRPFYSIVVADVRASRDGNFIEKIGTYNPMLPKDNANRITLKQDRVQYWLGVGAQPTERVTLFLANLGLVNAPKLAAQTKQDKPKAKAQERVKMAEEKARIAAELAEAEKAKAAEPKAAPAEEAASDDAAA